jgi:HK97 family phage major capsid protein
LRTPEQIAYDAAFQAHVRKGDVQAALSTGSDTDGGYTAPIEWDRTIQDKLKLVSPIRTIADVKSTTKRGWTKLLNDREIGSGWVGETAARPQTTTPHLIPYAVPIGEIYANPAATQDLLDDSEINIEKWLAEEVEYEFSRQEGIAFVNGDGVNKPRGLLQYTAAGVHPWGAIPEIKSGVAATVGTGDTLIDLVHDLPAQLAADASFLMNRNTVGRIRKMKDGQGNYMWQPSLQQGQPQTLMGYRLVEASDMPNADAGAIPIVFGDFRRGYLIVDRFGVRVLRDPYTNKPYVLFYTTKRVGGIVQDPTVLRYFRVGA